MAGKTVEIKAAAQGDDETKRERSKIVFPYYDLNDAVDIVKAVHANAGLSCEIAQLAGYMKQSATSGAFRLTVSTARIFGLTENEKGRVTLTELGRRVIDPAQEKRARVEAFLCVPLYRAIYDKYKGHMLPPTAALEREMGALGVSSKQTDKARQAFERSASQAGYFEHGRDRLVMPAFASQPPETMRIEPEQESPAQAKNGSGGGGGADHHFIKGLLNKLPEPEGVWRLTDRVKWLQTAAHIFDLMYQAEDEEVGDIEVRVRNAREDRGA